MDVPTVSIRVAPEADDLQRFAASELQKYLHGLFDVHADILATEPPATASLFMLGSMHDPHIREALVAPPSLSAQGYLVRRSPLNTMVLAGGSSVAVLWAVYDLLECYGVRYLLDGDVYPDCAGAFFLPEVDRIREPLVEIRTWPLYHDHPFGPGSWGLAERCSLIDQLAKLRFNRVQVTTWPWEPYLDLEIDGVKRHSAALWFGYHYPITDDMPGREVFGNEEEFWPPDLPYGAGYEETVAAGETLFHRVIAHAHARGMEVSFCGFTMEFPHEFRHLVPDAQTVHQLGDLTVGPGASVRPDDPELARVAGAAVRSIINTYPDADVYSFGMPEHRAWVEQYRWAWDRLDAKYGIGRVMSVEDAVQRAANRTEYPGGAERAVTEVKADITALYFLDRLFGSPDVIPMTCKPDARVSGDFVAEELWPILGHLLPEGREMSVWVDYTPSRVLRRREVLSSMPTDRITAVLLLTLHDDNVGVLPQLATGSIHELMCDLRDHGWRGFCTRYWMPSDHEPCLAYLAKAAWDRDVTPEDAYRDQVSAVCGESAVEPMARAFRELETVTRALEDHGLGLTFPVPGMMMKHWSAGSFSRQLAEDREGYRRALEAVREVPEPARPQGKAYVAYWTGRLTFGIGYLDTIDEVCRAATAEPFARESATRLGEVIEHAEAALRSASEAIEALARVAKNQSDRGAIAIMAEYVYRPLKQKIQALRATGSPPGTARR